MKKTLGIFEWVLIAVFVYFVALVGVVIAGVDYEDAPGLAFLGAVAMLVYLIIDKPFENKKD